MQSVHDRIASLPAGKRELLERRLRGQIASQAVPPIPVTGARIVPLTRRQQGIWVSQCLYGTTPLWNLTDAFRLQGPLDRSLLKRAVEICFARHDILRSRVTEGDSPSFERLDDVAVPLTVIDLLDRPRDEAEREALALADEAAGTPLDMHRASLLRMTLVCLEPERHLLVFVLHHMAGDGWSLGVFMAEIRQVYAALLAGDSPRLPPLPLQFGDYATWMSSGGGVPAAQKQAMIARVRETLAGAPPLVSFPTDFPRPAVFRVDGDCRRFRIADAVRDGLSGLSRRLGVSLFTVLLAGFKTLLHRYSGAADVVVGSSSANRNRLEIQPLVGMFVNTLVYRTDLSGDPSFIDVVRRVNDVAIKAQATQDVPYEDVLATLDLPRDTSYQPVFQVMFIYQNWPFSDSEIGGARLGRVGIHSGTAKHDLHFVLEERDGGLEVCVEYNTALYRETTIDRLAAHFHTLLEGAVGNPDCPISSLPLLDPAGRKQILDDWNETAADYQRESSLQDLIARQATMTPLASALLYGEEALSYRELDARSNQVAHLLRSRGVDTNIIVGLCIERSADMVVLLLGILKAGGVYLPLDPSYPDERLQYMVSDAKPRILITERSYAERLIGRCTEATAVLVWEDCRADLLSQLSDAVEKRGGPDDLAYVIYTSGSTGRPKGVMVPHRALVNFLEAMAVEPGCGPDDVVAATTPLSFDIAGLELYLPLTRGAQVVLVPRAVTMNMMDFGALVAKSRITMIQATPSMWQLIVDTGWRPPPGLKVLTGGEALAPDLAAILSTAPDGAWNMYGPTESTIWSMVGRLEPDEAVVSIGRPIANTQVYILDSAMQPVPIGVAGELYIGGHGLARGYLGRPDLTAERFVSNPFRPKERIYRTGDLARWQENGTVEFMGRADQQVKLHGHRIELGEIEARLLEIPSVERAIVLAREDTPGRKRLVAYIVGGAEIEALRGMLQRTLPEYMVPAAFVGLEAFPMTANGKIDRLALPAPATAASSREFVAARSSVPLEGRLAAIWREVLAIPAVGIDDNFFELGGNSALLIRVHSRLATEHKLPVTAMFQYPTVRTLAEYLSGAKDGEEDEMRMGQVRGRARKESLARRRRDNSERHV